MNQGQVQKRIAWLEKKLDDCWEGLKLEAERRDAGACENVSDARAGEGRMSDELSRARAAAAPTDRVEVGQWFWVEGRDEPWLGCAIHIGSNYVEVDGPHFHNRIHFDDFWARCRREPNPEQYIDQKVAGHQTRVPRNSRRPTNDAATILRHVERGSEES
jgi:hypothetical protein